MVATFEHIPPSPTDVVEWYARMEALNGGSPIEGHGFDASGNLARRYRTLDSSQLATIGSQYGASLYLTDNQSPHGPSPGPPDAPSRPVQDSWRKMIPPTEVERILI